MYHGNRTSNSDIKSWGCDMTYQWCHGPKCHKNHTQDRIRGVKGNKVLRTRKIKQTQWNHNNYYSHFCSQGCYTDFFYEHWEEFIRLHPRTEPLETPIEVKKVEREGVQYRHGPDGYIRVPTTFISTEIVDKPTEN